jgi:hypothetical protein
MRKALLVYLKDFDLLFYLEGHIHLLALFPTVPRNERGCRQILAETFPGGVAAKIIDLDPLVARLKGEWSGDYAIFWEET